MMDHPPYQEKLSEQVAKKEQRKMKARREQDRGIWYGLGGGLLALGLIAYGLFALKKPVARLSGLYDSSFTVLSLDVAESMMIVGTGVLLGLVGSWIAAARHMRRIEPR
jgi:cell division transport system permease protein